MTIPKRIFYVWGTGEAKRPDVEFCINTWKANCPDYEIIEINEDSVEYFNFKEELKNNKWFESVYERKMFAYVADYIRIKTLYNNGGIYLDTDVTVIKNFDNFLNEPAFVGLQSDKDISNDIFEPAILAAQKGNKLFKQILDFYNEDIWKMQIYRMPQVFSYFIKLNYGDFNNQPKEQQEIIRYSDITIYPEKYFIPFRYGDSFTTKCIEKDTHTVHWWGASWCKPEIVFFLENKHRIPMDKIDEEYKRSLKERVNINNTYIANYSKNSFLQNIFSIRNTKNKKHKVTTILGLKIKLRNKNA